MPASLAAPPLPLLASNMTLPPVPLVPLLAWVVVPVVAAPPGPPPPLLVLPVKVLLAAEQAPASAPAAPPTRMDPEARAARRERKRMAEYRRETGRRARALTPPAPLSRGKPRKRGEPEEKLLRAPLFRGRAEGPRHEGPRTALGRGGLGGEGIRARERRDVPLL